MKNCSAPPLWRDYFLEPTQEHTKTVLQANLKKSNTPFWEVQKKPNVSLKAFKRAENNPGNY